MFDINDSESTRIVRARDYIGDEGGRRPGSDTKAWKDDVADQDIKSPDQISHKDYDSDEMEQLHGKLMGYYIQERDRQSDNRYQQAIDEDYYDSIQWTEEEAAELASRGQSATVYNVLKTSCDWVIGTEKQNRTDFNILPRGPEDVKPAQRKSAYLKYLSDANSTPYSQSMAFEDAVKVGVGWLEDGYQDEDDTEQVYSRAESWRNMLWDSMFTDRINMSDCRYLARQRFVDVDVACAYFPDRAGLIEETAQNGSRYGIGPDTDGDEVSDYMEEQRSDIQFGSVGSGILRDRVRIIEFWYRIPKKVKKLKGGIHHGEIYNEDDSRHTDAVTMKASTIITRMAMTMRVCLMTSGGILWEGESPYRHNNFPFTPIWCYVRGRDKMPYGMVRQSRDIQDGVNKNASKFRHILASNKVMIEEGSLPEGVTLDQFAEEVARPDGILVYRKGYQAPKIDADRELAAPFMEMFSRDIQMIQQVSGVTDENMGRKTNATSGVAIEARQAQGSIVNSGIFDSLRMAKQKQGEKQLSIVEQFVTEKKQFRITNTRGQPEFEAINDGLPENDIARTKADFIVSEVDWRASIRQAATDQLMLLLAKMPPEIAINMLDLLVDGMDIVNKDEIVKRIREVNGQKDPDQTEPTPEDLAKQAAQAKQQAFNEEMAAQQLAEQTGKAQKVLAEAAKTDQNTQLLEAQTINTRVLAMQGAMVAAQGIVLMPTIASVGDELLGESGWPQFQPPGAQQGINPQQQPQQAQQIPQQMQQPAGMPPAAPPLPGADPAMANQPPPA